MASSSCISEQQRYTGLYQMAKTIVWIIRVTGVTKKGREQVVRHGTAFSINNNGVIISCAQIFNGLNNDIIVEARRLDMDSFISTVSLIDQRNRWDLCLLKVEGIVNCNFANLASDGSLHEGEILVCVANPRACVGSFGLGHVHFRCVENVTIPTGLSSCSRYDPCTSGTTTTTSSMGVTPEYRIMGHVWNKVSLLRDMRAGLINKDDYVWNLHPLIPIIQCGFISTGEGCVGAPIFNTRGEVVGILASHNRSDQIAIHVTLIRDYLRQAL